ncbi:hypothetical protein DLJ48_06845 [Oenococcus sicerae]|uniref:Uncharacterized protein n=1 Tax=Oenococcus sicerae TaxID=2203724 RepID=A0ABX5QNK9_9LACO|nr:hypothetical protein [Oenococcus sicerae]QAS70257.1 hypothetical protein DLJ48_06845 [Oenococcus sicerae]
MYISQDVDANQVNFLASEHFISFTDKVDATSYAVQTDELGHKVIPAGTVFPTNDASAQGITLNEVDVSNGTQLVPIVREGWVFGLRLPVLPTTAAVTALTTIHFKDAADVAAAQPQG